MEKQCTHKDREYRPTGLQKAVPDGETKTGHGSGVCLHRLKTSGWTRAEADCETYSNPTPRTHG